MKLMSCSTTISECLPFSVRNSSAVRASMFFKLDSAQKDRLAEVLHTIHLADAVSRLSGNLSHGQKQWLEIGMLLMQEPKLLLLDEPVAGMSPRERELTGDLLNRISQGKSVVVIEHDMDFVRRIARKVTVLHQGKLLSEGSVAQVQADQRVIDVYLGH